jgi:hypothetical protein
MNMGNDHDWHLPVLIKQLNGAARVALINVNSSERFGAEESVLG